MPGRRDAGNRARQRLTPARNPHPPGDRERFKAHGVFSEVIQYKTRLFIPLDRSNEVIDGILAMTRSDDLIRNTITLRITVRTLRARTASISLPGAWSPAPVLLMEPPRCLSLSAECASASVQHPRSRREPLPQHPW
jgi:hypothetical protein